MRLRNSGPMCFAGPISSYHISRGTMNEHHDSSATGSRRGNTEDQVQRWLEALAPLLNRPGPLAPREAEAWRRRLPALIARGELLRYRYASAEAVFHGSAIDLLDPALDEARS